MISLDIGRDDLLNLIEFFDLSFFDHLKKLLEDEELDNIAYLGSMYRIHEALLSAEADFEKKEETE